MRETTHCSCDFQVKAVNIFKKNEFILVLNKVLITSHYSSRKPCLERVKFILKIKISDIMSKQKFVVFLIAIIGMIATFLPWYEIGSLGMIMGYQTVGWFTFIMFALVFLFGLIIVFVEIVWFLFCHRAYGWGSCVVCL